MPGKSVALTKCEIVKITSQPHILWRWDPHNALLFTPTQARILANLCNRCREANFSMIKRFLECRSVDYDYKRKWVIKEKHTVECQFPVDTLVLKFGKEVCLKLNCTQMQNLQDALQPLCDQIRAEELHEDLNSTFKSQDLSQFPGFANRRTILQRFLR